MLWYNAVMSKKRKKSSGQAALIFIVVLALVLITGFGAMFLYLGSRGELAIPYGQEEAEEVEEQEAPAVVAEVEKIEEEPEIVTTIEEEEVIEDTSRYGSILADEELCREKRIYKKDAVSEEQIELLFAGDVGLIEGFANLEQLLQRGGDITEGFDANTLGIMRGADVFMINNEFTYTNRGTPTADKTYTFRCKPEYVHYVSDMGADIVSLANNHVYDYGEISLLDTLDTLEGADIPYVGAGRNIDEAIKPVYFIVNDVKIAYISATQIERVSNPDTKGATETSAGTFRCFYDDRVCDVVKEAAENSDYVIAYIHWGTELEVEPDWAQYDLAPKLQKAGADLIIGDHPHILQKMDYIEDTPIIYSMGNYWFNSKTLDTGLVEVVLNTDATVKSVRFIPAIQSGCRCNVATGTEKTRIINYMQSISSGVTFDEEGYVYKK